MAAYIIAGEAGSEDFVTCRYLGQMLEMSAPDVTVHIVTKHPSDWSEFIAKTCNGFGFYEISSPIIFTADGKLIGDKFKFKRYLLTTYGIKSDLKKSERKTRAQMDFAEAQKQKVLLANGPEFIDRVTANLESCLERGQFQVLDGFYEQVFDAGVEFYVKKSEMLAPDIENIFTAFGEDMQLMPPPGSKGESPNVRGSLEVSLEAHAEVQGTNSETIKIVERLMDKENSDSEIEISEEGSSPVPQLELSRISNPANISLTSEKEDSKDKSLLHSSLNTSGMHSATDTEQDDSKTKAEKIPEESEEADSILNLTLSDYTVSKFIKKFEAAESILAAAVTEVIVQVPDTVRTVPIPDSYVVESLENDYILALHPFPIVRGQMIIFPAERTDSEGRWMIRDVSMMDNWLKLVNIPPQRPVYKEGKLIDPVIPKPPVNIKEMSGYMLSDRGHTQGRLSIPESSLQSTLRLNTIEVRKNHLLTTIDWEVWFSLVRKLDALGFYQWLPYASRNYTPLSAGVMSILWRSEDEAVQRIPIHRLIELEGSDAEIFTLEVYEFDHVFHRLYEGSDLEAVYMACIDNLDLISKDFNSGVNILLTKDWLFMAPIYRPIEEVGDIKYYLDPLAYAGLLHLPVMPKKWPETAGVVTNRTAMEFLHRTSSYSPDKRAS
mmetsp:Transcript_4784/g.8923  ORF Transcript_4784/g.8923 Transcript_4784/m.8923 type:complete len:663 (-) Transcript_4784:1769-3757(-)